MGGICAIGVRTMGSNTLRPLLEVDQERDTGSLITRAHVVASDKNYIDVMGGPRVSDENRHLIRKQTASGGYESVFGDRAAYDLVFAHESTLLEAIEPGSAVDGYLVIGGLARGSGWMIALTRLLSEKYPDTPVYCVGILPDRAASDDSVATGIQTLPDVCDGFFLLDKVDWGHPTHSETGMEVVERIYSLLGVSISEHDDEIGRQIADGPYAICGNASRKAKTGGIKTLVKHVLRIEKASPIPVSIQPQVEEAVERRSIGCDLSNVGKATLLVLGHTGAVEPDSVTEASEWLEDRIGGSVRTVHHHWASVTIEVIVLFTDVSKTDRIGYFRGLDVWTPS